jgi:RNA polymerase sigma-70 factor (ECF subfamily)
MNSHQYKSQVLTLSDKLFRLAKSILRHEEEARDAVQELNLKLWEKRESLDSVDNIQAFTMQSMRNLCLDTLRKSKNIIEMPTEIEYDAPNPYQQTELNDTVNKIRVFISKLPELQRTIIQMRDVEGMEISEIAFVTSLTENAVSVNLSRARQKVREQILSEHQKAETKIWTN